MSDNNTQTPTPDKQVYEFLTQRGLPIADYALCSRNEEGDYLVCNFAPIHAREKVEVAGFEIVREWILTGGFFGDQYYIFRDMIE
jgi:hypothetical protein